MDRQHTPGQWKVSGIDSDLEGYKITDIGPTQSHDGDEASEYIATVYNKANANLIASAPTLEAENVRLAREKAELVKTLRRLREASHHSSEVDWLGDDEPWENADATLTKGGE